MKPNNASDNTAAHSLNQLKNVNQQLLHDMANTITAALIYFEFIDQPGSPALHKIHDHLCKLSQQIDEGRYTLRKFNARDNLNGGT